MSDPQTAPATPKNAAKKTAATTEYQILTKVDLGLIDVTSTANPEYWAPLQVVAARSANEAIRKAAANAAGAFIAVPARSWRPVTVRVEQTTRITLT